MIHKPSYRNDNISHEQQRMGTNMNTLHRKKKIVNYNLHVANENNTQMLIHRGAYSSNLSIATSLHTDPTKLCHCRHKRFEKGCLIRCKPVHSCSGPLVAEQNLV